MEAISLRDKEDGIRVSSLALQSGMFQVGNKLMASQTQPEVAVTPNPLWGDKSHTFMQVSDGLGLMHGSHGSAESTGRKALFPSAETLLHDMQLNSIVPGYPSDKCPHQALQEASAKSMLTAPVEVQKKKRYRKRGIYDKALDTDVLKQKRKKRAVELKLKNLSWTLNESAEVTGKRPIKAPERFELAHLSKRKTSMDDAEGDGDLLGSIPWIVQHIRDANIYTLRLLHRVIFRKQGMFSEKHIRRSVMTFRGFPFDYSSPEVQKRKMPMEKASITSLAKLCDLLGIKTGEKTEMIEAILRFLHRPCRQQVEDFLKDIALFSVQQKDLKEAFRMQFTNPQFPGVVNPMFNMDENSNSSLDDITFRMNCPMDNSILTCPWVRPPFFIDGKGTKLKGFKPIVANIQVATQSFVEMLHRLLFLSMENGTNLKRNILEFSGFGAAVGSSDYIYRNKLLFALPLDQLKLICRVLCLPTWHRSRQFLIDGIMNFLTSPCWSAMKKTVPPPGPTLGGSPLDLCKREEFLPCARMETEEIEIVPDIHIPDDDYPMQGKDLISNSSDDVVVKLKNFPNIHYHIISTPASKLNDLHMILFGRPCPLNNIRKNILEFTSFPFHQSSPEYQSRRAILEQMSLESLITIVTVLSLTPYVVDLSRVNIIEAVLKFLLRPSALLNSDRQMSPVQTNESMKNISLNVLLEEKNRANLDMLGRTGEITIQPVNLSSSEVPVAPAKPKDGVNKRKSQPPVKVVTKSPTVSKSVKVESKVGVSAEFDEPLAKVQKTGYLIGRNDQLLESDENDDEPLSKFIGHPNDDQLRVLIAKIIKESILNNITMKQVIRIVFNTYPNYDLAYRKEFIKSVVRQILSQMDESRCAVSTTVLTF